VAREEDELMDRSQASDYLHTPTATLASWAYKRIGPEFYRVGKRCLYRRSELDRWLETQRVPK
jgi:Helix-turn-helix domain